MMDMTDEEQDIFIKEWAEKMKLEPIQFIPIERSYTREEVETLLIKHQSDYRNHVRRTNDWSFDIKTWIKEKLK